MVAVTYAKTEVLQIALLAAIVLSEVPDAVALAGMLVSTAGVLLLSLRGATARGGSGKSLLQAALHGMAAGAAFALAAVAYRLAGLDLLDAGTPLWIGAAWSVVIAQVVQSAFIGGWLWRRDPPSLRHALSSWRTSMIAGMAGGIASVGWFAAYILRPAADVRALSMLEVAFSFYVSRRLLGERVGAADAGSIVMVILGAIAVCLG